MRSYESKLLLFADLIKSEKFGINVNEEKVPAVCPIKHLETRKHPGMISLYL